MATKLPIDDGERFIARLEEGIEEGDPDFIERNMPALEKLIARYMDRCYELAGMQERARLVRERREPPAGRPSGRW